MLLPANGFPGRPTFQPYIPSQPIGRPYCGSEQNVNHCFLTPGDRLLQRAIQNQVNLAIREIPQVVPPQLTPNAKALLYNTDDYIARRCIETTGDALQNFLVMDVIMEAIPEASVQELSFISRVMESNETLCHYASRIDGVGRLLVRDRSGANALELIIGTLARDIEGDGIKIARDWYLKYFSGVARHALSAYRTYYQSSLQELTARVPLRSVQPSSNNSFLNSRAPVPLETSRIHNQISTPPYTPHLKRDTLGKQTESIHQRQASLRKILVERRDSTKKSASSSENLPPSPSTPTPVPPVRLSKPVKIQRRTSADYF